MILPFPTALQRHPVAHGRQFGIRFGVMIDLAAEDDLELVEAIRTIVQQRAVADFVVANQPRRHPATRTERLEGLSPSRIPTKIFESETGHGVQRLTKRSQESQASPRRGGPMEVASRAAEAQAAACLREE
jgi:hypothetical protein